MFPAGLTLAEFKFYSFFSKNHFHMKKTINLFTEKCNKVCTSLSLSLSLSLVNFRNNCAFGCSTRALRTTYPYPER